MKFTVIILFALLLIVGSCEKEGEQQLNKVCFTRTNTHLKINNGTEQQIYFAAFGQDILPVINWVPLCIEEKGISAKSSASLELSSISTYAERRLVVYWWQCGGNTPGQLKNVTLTKNETECR